MFSFDWRKNKPSKSLNLFVDVGFELQYPLQYEEPVRIYTAFAMRKCSLTRTAHLGTGDEGLASKGKGWFLWDISTVCIVTTFDPLTVKLSEVWTPSVVKLWLLCGTHPKWCMQSQIPHLIIPAKQIWLIWELELIIKSHKTFLDCEISYWQSVFSAGFPWPTLCVQHISTDSMLIFQVSESSTQSLEKYPAQQHQWSMIRAVQLP